MRFRLRRSLLKTEILGGTEKHPKFNWGSSNPQRTIVPQLIALPFIRSHVAAASVFWGWRPKKRSSVRDFLMGWHDCAYSGFGSLQFVVPPMVATLRVAANCPAQ